MDIKIGELKDKIQIVSKEYETDEIGDSIEVPKEIWECWAKVFNKSGTEIFKAQANFNKIITHFIVRHRKDKEIDVYMDIKFNGLTYNIKYINNYGYRNEYLEIVGEAIF